MKRGEVWWVNFDPSVGCEVKKERPAIIVSIDPFNKHSNRLQVIPITSNVSRLYPSEVVVTVNNNPNKALIDQIATVSKQRFRKKIDTLSEIGMNQVGETIKLHLGLI